MLILSMVEKCPGVLPGFESIIEVLPLNRYLGATGDKSGEVGNGL